MNADKFVVRGQTYDVLSPATFGDYIETVGAACINPSGYPENKLFLAYDDNVQKLFRATAAIAYSELLIKNTNCEPTTMAEALANALSAGGVSYDNTDSGLTASNAQGAIDEVNGKVETVKSDLTNEIITRSKISAHNFLLTDIGLIKRKNTEGNWVGNAYTLRGITYTVNDDLTVTVSGTNSSGSESYLYLTAASSEALRVPVDNYILSGCPSGGGDSSYRLQATLFDASGAYITGSDVFDFGEGVSLNIQNKEYAIRTHIAVRTGVSISSPITFKPMLRVSTDPSNVYSEPTKTNRQLSGIGNAYLVARDNVSIASSIATPLTDLVLTLLPGKYLISTCTNKGAQSSDMSASDTKAYIDDTPMVTNADAVTILSEYGTSAPWYFNYGKYYGKLAYIEGTKTMTVYPQLYNYSGSTVKVTTRVIAIKLS